MILVDTSVWIDFFRGHTVQVKTRLTSLLETDEVAIAAPVRVEILGGVAKQWRRTLTGHLAALLTLEPTSSTWALMERWALRAADEGQHFGVGDLLIAALAAEREAPVWSLDRDFERLERLGFVHLA
jgi:hypothetical protein